MAFDPSQTQYQSFNSSSSERVRATSQRVVLMP
jgi:hypothetical protein